MTLKQIAEVMGNTEGYIKSLFVGVNEINHDDALKDLIGDAGITIRDIAETSAVSDRQQRLNLLEQRRALHNVLKDKGVITEEYTTEMWDNDFKAWKKNPNNGIFRYLEMVSAILDAVQIFRRVFDGFRPD